MADPRLDDLLKQWAEHEALGDLGKDCPAVSVLWLHATQDQPFSEHDAHVQDCARCRKRLEMIHHELEASAPVLASDTKVSQGAAGLSLRDLRDLPGEKTAPPRRFPVLWLTGTLAAAACLTLLVLNWSVEPAGSRRFDVLVADYLDLTGSAATPIFRGPNGVPTTMPRDSEGWLQALLDDEQAEEALSDRDFSELILLRHQEAGRIVIVDGRPTIAPDTVLEPAKREALARQLRDDDDACARIVAVLIRHPPDASENNVEEARKDHDRGRGSDAVCVEESPHKREGNQG